MTALDSLSRVARLWIVFGFNLALIGALAAVGVVAHSLGVFAEGADYLADAAGIGVALFAISLSKRRHESGTGSRYPNATNWAALVNGGWLLILTLLVSAGAIDRLVSGTRPVQGMPVLIVSGVAALVMLLGALILGGEVDDDGDDDAGDLHIKAVLLDTAADAAAAASVAVTGAIILATNGSYWLDPTVALVVSVVIAYHAIVLLRKVVHTLRHDPRIP